MTTKIFNAALYNNLHYIDTATQLFTNRDEVLNKLGPILQQYGEDKFGVCLVHRHCELEEGERMVSEGCVSQPEHNAEQAYPERWLATGEPYEFTRDITHSPSEELFKHFRIAVGCIEVLGLFYIRDEDRGGITLERTEGRKNITKIISPDTPRNAITTAWTWIVKEGTNSSYDSYRISVVECSLCEGGSNFHVQGRKLRQLMTRRDLGHVVPGSGDCVCELQAGNRSN